MHAFSSGPRHALEHEDPLVEVWFPVRFERIPSDHGYALYAAIARRLPQLHEADWWGLHTIAGQRDGSGWIHPLRGGSRMGVRLPARRIADLLPLSGTVLRLRGAAVAVGPPYVQAVVPGARLQARIVTIRNHMDATTFASAAREQLDRMGIEGTLAVGRRQVVHVAGKAVVGFAVEVSKLSPEASRRLVRVGLGGRRRLGCGLFVPARRPLRRDARPVVVSP